MTGPVTGVHIRSFSDALAEGLRPTFQAISDLVEPAVVLAKAPDTDGAFESSLAMLDAACRAGLTLEPELLHGAGYMAEPEVIADADYWARWWWRTPAGELQVGEHALDPANDAFYDYPSTEWFTALRDGEDDTVFGPYVDFNGTNDYTVTLARAVRLDGVFLGSVGGDITVSALERRFEPILRDLGVPALLANEENRVVISTDAQWTAGSRLRASSSRPQQSYDLAPWTLVVFD
ncbi:cache domain-containing protein [uncultured Microbacterium sp.]|uniref:cache domain-containing protein n=1 Tax=uncultured Microbacterium sp. TaxID=191216 RepID=UPI0035C9DDFF